MGSKAYFENDIRERAAQLNSMDDALCIGLLSLSSYSSSARASMLSQHLVQSLLPVNPEIPGVATGYEYLFGKYSTGYKQTDDRLKVVKKIEKHPGYVYTLITYNPKTEEYGIIQRQEVKNLAEEFGFKWDNTEIDKLKPGSTIYKGTVLSKSPAYDENMNYRYGVNAKVLYTISQETIEDAVVVSESFAKKAATTFVETCLVPLNDNDIPLNLYGDNDTYQSFPEVGDKTKRSIIFASRRKNKTMDQFNLKNANLRKLFASDDVFQMADDYTIADIDIWANKPLDEIPDLPAYCQVRRYMRRLIEYYTQIKEELGKIIDTEGSKYTPELSRLYSKARDYLDPGRRYADDDRIFSNIEMEFTIYRNEKLRTGCKICGRYGNKSVISKVLPDEEMGHTENGTVPDIRIDALGVLGRLNTGQCIEQELNWVAEEVRQRIVKAETLEKKLKILFKFLDIAAPKESESMKEYLADYDIKQKEVFIAEIEKDRIYLLQSPMYCATTETLRQLYREFQPKLTKMFYINEYGDEAETIRPMIVADEYIMVLKQMPITKFSVRSKSMNNPRTAMPIKSTKAAKHKIIYPDQCNRLGEQEANVLMLSSCYDALDYFFRSYSSSIEGRRTSELFTEDPNYGFIINMPDERSRSVEMLNAYLKTMGYYLNIKYTESSNDPVIAECDIPKIPDYIKKML